MLFNSSALETTSSFSLENTCRDLGFQNTVQLFLALRLPCLNPLLSRRSRQWLDLGCALSGPLIFPAVYIDEYVKVKCLVGFWVSPVFSLSLGFTLKSGFSQLWSCLSLSPELQALTPSDPLFALLFYTQDYDLRATICCVGIRWALLGGDYCQPKDLVLCGDEERKATSPTLRMGDLHFAELIMLIHDLLSKNLLRPICQTVLVTPNSEASCPHPLRSCSWSTIFNQCVRYHPYFRYFKLYPDSESGLISDSSTGSRSRSKDTCVIFQPFIRRFLSLATLLSLSCQIGTLKIFEVLFCSKFLKQRPTWSKKYNLYPEALNVIIELGTLFRDPTFQFQNMFSWNQLLYGVCTTQISPYLFRHMRWRHLLIYGLTSIHPLDPFLQILGDQ